MSDDPITAAFQKGIVASEKADALREFAERTIEGAAEKIAEASGRKIYLYLDETWVEKTNRLMTRAVETLMGPLVPERRKTHGIFAVVRDGDWSANDTLCIVTFSRDTFPIELQWETEAVICNEKRDLENGLARMIGDPRTGKKFRTLLEKLEARRGRTPEVPPGTGEPEPTAES